MDKIKNITIKHLNTLTKQILKKYNPKVIAITGNTGKTTTKDAIAAIFSEEDVRKTHKSFNSEIGIPLSVLGIKKSPWKNPIKWFFVFAKAYFYIIFNVNFPKYLVVEAGTDRKGDLKKISEVIDADVVVITRVPDNPVHLENFQSKEELLDEEFYMVENTNAQVIANCEDKNIYQRLKNKQNVKFYGINCGDAKVVKTSVLYEENFPYGSEYKIAYSDGAAIIRIKSIIGEHIGLCFAASILVAKHFGIDADTAVSNLQKNFKGQPGRMQILKGIKDTILIDDSYNSSPAAVCYGAKEVSKIKSKRKIAVLADMKELGDKEIDIHRKLARDISEYFDEFYVYGPLMKYFADELPKKSKYYVDTKKLVQDLKTQLTGGELIYFKGSQSMRVEKIIKEFIQNDIDKTRLPRQEFAWRFR